MSRHKSMYSFLFDRWYFWLLSMLIWSFICNRWVDPSVSFLKCLQSCVIFFYIYRGLDILEELWERTEKLREDKES